MNSEEKRNEIQDILYIVMPAYNEEANIKDVVMNWYPVLSGKNPDSKITIADSGSTDHTHAILLDLKKQYPQIEILDDTLKQHGPKVIALYDYAVRNNADYVFQTDSDGQTNPDEFEAFWNLRKDADAVIGNRTVRGDGQSRAFVERVVCLLLKIYFGVNVPDANAPFRLMKTSLVGKYLPRLPEDYNLPNIILTAFFAFYNEKILFREISFKPRQAGKNSIDMKKIFKIGVKALSDFHHFKKEMK